MSGNLDILHRKLGNLVRMRADVQHSMGKLSGPLETIARSGIDALTPDQRETLSAFTTRFATYQEQLGKVMRSVAVEEESAAERFGDVLALMEKFGILDSHQQWIDARELRNAANHVYEEDADELRQILGNMAAIAPWLMSVHERLDAFVARSYPPPIPPGPKTP